MKRDYYSVRAGKTVLNRDISLPMLRKLVKSVYEKLEEDGFFQKYFGYFCVDADSQNGMVKGELGSDISSAIFISLRKEGLWPVGDRIEDYSEDDLFDVVEFLHDHTSKPLKGAYHKFNNCGMHFDAFNDDEGQAYFRQEINVLLKDYLQGYEIDQNGHILSLPDEHMATLIEAEVPTFGGEDLSSKIQTAVNKFRRYGVSLHDRKDAIRDLADVLEYLRPEAQKVIKSKDESDLFNIANNFGIRHYNEKQKIDYDLAIWYSWLFYYYLASIQAFIRLIEKASSLK